MDKVKKYSDKFIEVEDYEDRKYFIRTFGTVSTVKHDKIELLAVADVQDYTDVVSEEELKQMTGGKPIGINITLVPAEKWIAKKFIKEANSDNSAVSGNTIVNIVNYMGGLYFNPIKKGEGAFDDFEQAEEYLQSKELNDQISEMGRLAGFTMDMDYNRLGQTNWERLAYMMGERDRFEKGGEVVEVLVSDLKPGLRIIQKAHPEYGTFVVQRKYDNGIWEIRGDSGDTTLFESELRFWKKAHSNKHTKGGQIHRYREIPALKDKKIKAVFNVDKNDLVIYDGRKQIAEISVKEMEDFWHSIEIDGNEYDVNLWMDSSAESFPKSFKASLYPVVNELTKTSQIHSIDDLDVINYQNTEKSYRNNEYAKGGMIASIWSFLNKKVTLECFTK